MLIIMPHYPSLKREADSKAKGDPIAPPLETKTNDSANAPMIINHHEDVNNSFPTRNSNLETISKPPTRVPSVLQGKNDEPLPKINSSDSMSDEDNKSDVFSTGSDNSIGNLSDLFIYFYLFYWNVEIKLENSLVSRAKAIRFHQKR